MSPQLIAEYEALTQRAGVVPLPDRTQIEVSGNDSATFLHNLCTNNVRDLLPGQGCEAFFPNVQGKILGHALVFREESSFVLETVAGQATKLLAHLERYLIREDVHLSDRTETWSQLLLAGAGSPQILSSLIGEPPPTCALGHARAPIAGVSAVVRRVEFVRPWAYLVSAERDEMKAVQRSLVESGAEPCSSEALEIARIEAGFPWYAKDITESNLPQEAGRDEAAISFTKGCYLGQETVARIDALGHVNWLLSGVQLASDAVPTAGDELRCGEKTVARITSATFSPKLGSPLAMAYVRREYHQVGTELETDAGRVRIIPLPVQEPEAA